MKNKKNQLNCKDYLILSFGIILIIGGCYCFYKVFFTTDWEPDWKSRYPEKIEYKKWCEEQKGFYIYQPDQSAKQKCYLPNGITQYNYY